LWSPEPVIYLGTESARRQDRHSIDASPLWNYAAGEKVRVLCYTNAAGARLFLNGKSVGEALPSDRKTGVVSWEMPFEPGRLEVIGVNAKGEEICRTFIESAAAPAALKVSTDETVIDRERGVATLSIQVVDRNDLPVLLATPDIACRISGPARLLGLEASDHRDMTGATTAARHAFGGRLVAYIEATGVAGTIQVTFTAPDLPEATTSLRVK
jgi:hypothetical protein